VLAKYLQRRERDYQLYFVAPPYIYLKIGSLKFLMPDIKGQDVLEPIEGPDDLDFVERGRDALFLFIPSRAQEFPIVQEAYPNGIVRNFNKPDGNSLFFIYEVPSP
jgi:hypothetical protein